MKKAEKVDKKMLLQIQKLKQENKAWKETCEILADKSVMEDIKDSLKQIKRGKGIVSSKL